MLHGQLWTTTEFSHYFQIETAEGRVTHWPRHIALKGYNAEGELGGQMTYSIISMKLNETIDDDVYTLDRENLIVWDEETQRYLDSE